MRIRGFLALAFSFLAIPSISLGQISKLDNNPFVNGVVANTVTNDVSIDFNGQYTGSQLRVQLTQGSIY